MSKQRQLIVALRHDCTEEDRLALLQLWDKCVGTTAVMESECVALSGIQVQRLTKEAQEVARLNVYVEAKTSDLVDADEVQPTLSIVEGADDDE